MLAPMYVHTPAVVTHAVDDEVFVVRVSGSLDHDSAPLLEEACAPAKDSGAPRTVIDLSLTDFADSTVLHVLLAAQRAHDRQERKLIVAGPFHRVIRRLFDVTCTAGYFTLADSMPRALEA
ncbi:STAS domain-containing protein [Streptomyces sp. NPDC048434]|uniref:STAS domain-containing protein n=1 Tax=Streptomyces sp. NPDC048434 TaxID=3365549 RepID=UPI0037151E8C